MFNLIPEELIVAACQLAAYCVVVLTAVVVTLFGARV